MVLRRALILTGVTTFILIPTAVVLHGSESRSGAGLANLTETALRTIADTVYHVRGSLAGEQPDRWTSPTDAAPAAAPPGERQVQAQAHPWDDPDWDDKVAAKILEKLLEEPIAPSSAPSVASDEPEWMPEEPPSPAFDLGADIATGSTVSGSSAPPEFPVSDSADSGWVAAGRAEPDSSGAETGELVPIEKPAPSAPELAIAAPDEEETAMPLPPPRPQELTVAKLAPADIDDHPANSGSKLRESATQAAVAYLRFLSTDARSALSALQGASATRIEYHGHSISRRAWLDKKRKFAETWPTRTYRHRPGSMLVECTRGTSKCVVRSTVDWEAANPARSDYATGSSKLELGIDLSGSRPRIHSETNLRIRNKRTSLRPLQILPADRGPEISDAMAR